MTDITLQRVYETPASGRATRVLIDRIWPRGVSRQKLAPDLWLKEIAPSTELRKWFGHDPARWDEFRHRYRAELDANPQPVARLRELAGQGPLVLLYAARDERHNHAIVLRDYLQS